MYNFLNLLMAVFKEINTFTYPKMKKKLKMKKIVPVQKSSESKRNQNNQFWLQFLFLKFTD